MSELGQWRVQYQSLFLMECNYRYFSTREEAQEFRESRSNDPWKLGHNHLVEEPEFVTVFDLLQEQNDD